MSEPLVSIIIPCYNYASYVEKAILSAAAQTHKNVELIVINDGSTDDSDSVIKGCLKKNKFKYVHQSNQGIIATRNKGVKLAKGDYIIQLDADDWLDKQYVEKTLQYAQQYKADIVYTQASIFGRVSFVTNFPDFNTEYLKHEGYINASALTKKTVFKGHKYDSYLEDKGNEDWDFFLDACLDGFTAKLFNEPLLHYRKHQEKASRADNFEGTRKELLVRHHVLSKQNAKHPDQMWYFSPYIDILKRYIDQYVEFAENKAQNEDLKQRVAYYRSLPSVRIVRSVKGFLKR